MGERWVAVVQVKDGILKERQMVEKPKDVLTTMLVTMFEVFSLTSPAFNFLMLA